MAAYTTIDDPEAYFQAKTYSGTGSSNAITFDGDNDMAPVVVWIKRRDTTGAGQLHHTQATNVDSFLPVDGGTDGEEDPSVESFSAFGSDGFTVVSHNGSNNASGTYVAWSWAGGTTSGITTNAATDITPSGYSFNQTSGFSLFKFTGNATDDQQVAHGIGKVVHFVITKVSSSSGDNWTVFHHKLHATDPGDKYLSLNTAGTVVDAATRWSDAEPDSVNITLGDSNSVNKSGATIVTMAWSEIQGYSKFGSFKGNGNSAGGDGTFVYLGFRPAFFLIKNTENSGGTGDWVMWDNKQNSWTGNPNDTIQKPNDNSAGYTHDNAMVDFLSNGVKIKGLEGGIDDSGDLVVYAAFAEAPLVNSNGVPCNAR